MEFIEMQESSWRRLGRRFFSLAPVRSFRRLMPPWSRHLPGIVGKVHPKDAMLYDDSEESIGNYVRAANSAIENLEVALAGVDRTLGDVESCLDFGCGHGRVLRFLQQKISPQKITACDVDADGVRFCAAEFGVNPLVSSWHAPQIRLGKYDLVWSGSVLTHLDGEDGDALLERLAESLMPGGVLVFSIHGQFCRDGLTQLYGGLYAEEAEVIRQEVAEQGYSFREYQGDTFGRFPVKYGMTWHDGDHLTERVINLSGGCLRRILWRTQGWDHHHDVMAFVRGEEP
jgi:SAM-dependent methyltransferase